MPRRFMTAMAASEALYDLLTGGMSIEVWWGFPGYPSAPEMCWVRTPESTDQDASALGQRRRDEQYLLDVIVEVGKNTQDPGEVNRALATHLRSIEQLVDANDNLIPDSNPDHRAGVSAIDTVVDTQPLSEQSYHGAMRLRVGCWARI